MLRKIVLSFRNKEEKLVEFVDSNLTEIYMECDLCGYDVEGVPAEEHQKGICGCRKLVDSFGSVYDALLTFSLEFWAVCVASSYASHVASCNRG